MKRLSLLLILFGPLIVAAQQQAYVSPAGTKFLLYLPPAYSTTTDALPLLVSLHGKGEWGTDLTKLTSGNPTGMPSRLIHLNQWPQNYKFIVLTPQYNPPDPNDPNPIWPASHIDEVVSYVQANWRVKKSKIYVTGLSLGANATWNYSAAYPHKVAAIVPISGRADLAKACLVKDIPAWVFHGDGDATATMAYSRDMVNAINNCQPSGSHNRKFTVLHSKGHDGWSEIYNGSNGYKIYSWLSKFSKGSSSNPSPYVNAGPDIYVKLSPNPVNIIGDAFDGKGTITNLRWTQISGTPLTMTNIDQENFQVSNLQIGTFEFELSATDNLGARSADKMKLKVYGSTSRPTVTNMVLINGETNVVIQNLTDGMILDKNALGLTQINVRADASPNTKSVAYSLNTNRNVRTINSPGPYLIKAAHSTRPEWEVLPGEYIICATPFSEPNAAGTRGVSQCLKITVIDGIPTAGCEGAGKMYREVWPGVSGSYVTDIPLATPPAVKGEIYSFESPTSETGAGDNYGARIRGYICPPATGDYVFWIASDNRSELWLSTDINPANKIKIAHVSGHTGSRQWDKYGAQKSATIRLQQGTKYYVEALHKESTGADHLAVGWQLPNDALERPIPGFRLLPFVETYMTSHQLVEFTLHEEDEITVYPNPFNSAETVMHIRGLNRASDSALDIQLTSITGANVRNLKVEYDQSSNDVVITLHQPISAGVYLIHATTNSERVVKRLLVY